MVEKYLSVQFFQSRWQLLLRCLISHQFNIALIVLGSILRLKHYLENRSFWLNEAWLALDISTRTFKHIISAVRFSPDLPVVPPGFALIEKCFISVFGNNEFAFRLFPLICGIVSLFLFYKILKILVHCQVIPLALGFFAFSNILIYHSSELKQYSSGVLVVLLLYLMMLRLDSSREMTVPCSVGYGFAGAAATGLFYPSVFILAGIGLTQIIGAFQARDWEKFKGLLFSSFCWLVSFMIVYIVFCRPMLRDEVMLYGISKFSIPYPIWELKNLRWLFEKSTRVFLDETVGMVPFWIGAYFIFAGIWSLWREDKRKCSALLLPVFFVLLAIVLRAYAFEARYLVGFIPGVLTVFACGVMKTMQCKRKVFIALNGILLGILLFHPLGTAVHALKYSYSREEPRPLVGYLKEYQRLGDALVINSSAQYAYAYYLGCHRSAHRINPFVKIGDKLYSDERGQNIMMRSEQYAFDENGCFGKVEKTGEISAVYEDMPEPFGTNKRTWIFFSHIPPDTKEFVLSLLNRIGVQSRKLEQNGSSLYLYDLSSKDHGQPPGKGFKDPT